MSPKTLLPSITAACMLALSPVLTFGSPASSPAPAPVLRGHTSRGETVDLAALRGKVVMLLFWSTDCAVCLNNLPELRRNLAGWRGKDFVVLAVDQDLSERSLTDYEALLDRLVAPDPQMKIIWRRAVQHRDNFGQLPIREPHTVVIDRSGQVFTTVHGRFSPKLWDDVAELVLN